MFSTVQRCTFAENEEKAISGMSGGFPTIQTRKVWT